MAAKRSRTARRKAGAAAGAAPPAARLRWGQWSWLAGAAVLAAVFLWLLLGAQGTAHAEFDQDRSFRDLTRQVDFGPRVPNTAGHDQCLAYLMDTLRPLCTRVEKQSFTQAVRNRTLRMANVIARWNGAGAQGDGKGILLCAHWDTRPQADYESTPERRARPIPGANDGASGVAVLLEMARVLKKTPPPVPVMLVFFDGEDYGPGERDMYLGAIYFAQHLPADVPRKGALLDMIGDRDLSIPAEVNSLQNAGDVVDEVYGAARRLNLDRYFPRTGGQAIGDDHLPLQAKGLKVIDLIDFDYGPNNSWWHTLEDTPDKCSPTSLKTVGDVLLEWTFSQK